MAYDSNNALLPGKKAKSLLSKGAVLIDVRSPVAYRDEHVPRSINCSLRQLTQVKKYPTSTPIIVYGDAGDPSTLSSALNYIRLYGFTKVYSLGTFSRIKTELSLDIML